MYSLLIVILAIAVVVLAIAMFITCRKNRELNLTLVCVNETCEEAQEEIRALINTVETCQQNMEIHHHHERAVFEKIVSILSTLPEYRNGNREVAQRGNHLHKVLNSVLVGHLADEVDVTNSSLYLECANRLECARELLGEEALA